MPIAFQEKLQEDMANGFSIEGLGIIVEDFEELKKNGG